MKFKVGDIIIDSVAMKNRSIYRIVSINEFRYEFEVVGEEDKRETWDWSIEGLDRDCKLLTPLDELL